MANLLDLPPEILREIILIVFHQVQIDDQFRYDGQGLTANPLPAYAVQKIINNSFAHGMEVLPQYERENIFPEFHVYSEMLHHRIWRESLRAMSLSCRLLHGVIQAILYVFVELDEMGTSASERQEPTLVEKCLRSIVAQPQVARYIRALSVRACSDEILDQFNGDYQSVMGRLMDDLAVLDSTSIVEVDRFINLVKPSFQLPLLLSLIPGLKSVRISMEFASRLLGYMVDSAPERERAPVAKKYLSNFQDVEEISLIWDDPDMDAFDSIILLPLFMAPKLRTLYFGSAMAGDIYWSSNDVVESKYIEVSSVTELIFDFSIVNPNTLATLLKIPKQLEKFRYSFGGESNRVEAPSMAEIVTALLPQRESLRSIDIRGCRHSRVEGDSLKIPNGFRPFRYLEELSFPFIVFGLDQSKSPALSNILPPRLRRLRLYAYDENNLYLLEMALIKMFDQGRGNHWKYLVHVGVDFWYDEELHRREIRENYLAVDGVEASDLKRTFDRRVTKLVNLGKDVGVHVEVNIDER